MFDLSNYQLITTPTIPGDVKDSKDIVLSETGVPGQNFQQVNYGGGGNRKISFTIPIMKRGDTGNVMLLKQFENLRNRASSFTDIFSSQFTPNPKVLFYWGTGSIPLVYWVKKCDFTHPTYWTNKWGATQYTLIDMELWLDEKSPLYKMEEIARKLASQSNFALQSVTDVTKLVKQIGKLV